MKKKLLVAFALFSGLVLVSCNNNEKVISDSSNLNESSNTSSLSEETKNFDILTNTINKGNEYKGNKSYSEIDKEFGTIKLIDQNKEEVKDATKFKEITGTNYDERNVESMTEDYVSYNASDKTLIRKYLNNKKLNKLEYYFTEGDTNYSYGVYYDDAGKPSSSSVYKVSEDHALHEAYTDFDKYFDNTIKFDSYEAYQYSFNLIAKELAGKDVEVNYSILEKDNVYTLTSSFEADSIFLDSIIDETMKINSFNMTLEINYNQDDVLSINQRGGLNFTETKEVEGVKYEIISDVNNETIVTYSKENNANLTLSETDLSDINTKKGDASLANCDIYYRSPQFLEFSDSAFSSFTNPFPKLSELNKLNHVTVKYYFDKEFTKEVPEDYILPSYNLDIYFEITVDDGYALVFSKEYGSSVYVNKSQTFEVINISEHPTYTLREKTTASANPNLNGLPFDSIKVDFIETTAKEITLENQKIYNITYTYKVK